MSATETRCCDGGFACWWARSSAGWSAIARRHSIRLDLELKADAVRIDMAASDGDCDFWDVLDDVVFTDLTSGWGRDRRRSAGAWFEVAAVDHASPRQSRR